MADADATAEPPKPAADLTGRTLGDFQVLRKIGSGGMGQVYLARQMSLRREVALKLLRSELNANPTALKRFEAEAHAVARLNHPNIVQVYAVGEHDGLRYMALEFVDGRNLRDYLARRGPPDLPVALSVMRQVATALQKAHEQGIVHRDIKPENVLVTRKVEVKVTDFGLSRFFAGADPALNITQSGVTLGTPLYLSPEQAQGHAVDHRSDLYSFGVTCYHLLAGDPPFRGTTAVEVALKHVTEAPRPLNELRPDLPADLCGLVHRLLAKNPADRPATARDVIRELAKVREGVGHTQALSLPTGPVPTAGPTVGGGSAGTPGIVLSMSGGASGDAAVPVGATQVMTAATPPPAPRVRWGRWAALALLCAAGTAGGAVGYGLLHPPDAPAPAAGGGLPDVRPPQKFTTARERELVALVNSRQTPPQDVILAGLELGLLYVRERRLDDADARFKELEAERHMNTPQLLAKAHLAGRLGQAIVLAYRDKATESNRAFEEALRGSGKGLLPKGVAQPALVQQAVKGFLLGHPSVSQAVAEALDRNAENLGAKKLPPQLEQLRQARDLAKPAKG